MHFFFIFGSKSPFFCIFEQKSVRLSLFLSKECVLSLFISRARVTGTYPEDRVQINCVVAKFPSKYLHKSDFLRNFAADLRKIL